jgi:hypothetical protein
MKYIKFLNVNSNFNLEELKKSTNKINFIVEYIFIFFSKNKNNNKLPYGGV